MLRGPRRPQLDRQLPRRRRELHEALILVVLPWLAGCRASAECTALLDVQLCGDDVRAEAAPPRPGGGPWRCDAERCVQRMPRLPDDGAWECADLDGIVVCHGGTPPAGVVVGPAEAGWICGGRRGAKPGVVDRVCVDLAPDFPEGRARGWRCNYGHDGGERRQCRRDPAAPALAAPCDSPRACKPGDRCVDGRCVLPRPRPDCWIDPDCGAGAKCRRGTCG